MRTYINDAILKMQERGKLMELKKKWWVDLNGGGLCDVSGLYFLCEYFMYAR